MSETLNSQINLVLANVPEVGDGDVEEMYRALLRIHQAVEILVAFYDTNGALYVTLADTQNIAGAKTFLAGTTLNALLTLADAVNIVVNTTTGTKIGTATGQKLGFWNATPIVQPAGANQAALTNSTGGSYNGTLESTTGTASLAAAADGVKTNNNFTDVYTLLNEIRNALVNAGLMKGAA